MPPYLGYSQWAEAVISPAQRCQHRRNQPSKAPFQLPYRHSAIHLTHSPSNCTSALQSTPSYYSSSLHTRNLSPNSKLWYRKSYIFASLGAICGSQSLLTRAPLFPERHIYGLICVKAATTCIVSEGGRLGYHVLSWVSVVDCCFGPWEYCQLYVGEIGCSLGDRRFCDGNRGISIVARIPVGRYWNTYC